MFPGQNTGQSEDLSFSITLSIVQIEEWHSHWNPYLPKTLPKNLFRFQTSLFLTEMLQTVQKLVREPERNPFPAGKSGFERNTNLSWNNSDWFLDAHLAVNKNFSFFKMSAYKSVFSECFSESWTQWGDLQQCECWKAVSDEHQAQVIFRSFELVTFKYGNVLNTTLKFEEPSVDLLIK